MATLSIVSPFFNEAQSAAKFSALINDLSAELKEAHGLSTELVLVDDGSSDGSAEIFANTLSGNWTIVELSRNFGKEIALLAGVERTSGDYVLLLDADLQHSKAVALSLIERLISDDTLDMVYTYQESRADAGWRRTQLGKLFYRLINTGQRFKLPENAGDFRIMRRSVADAFVSMRDKRRFNKGLYSWLGFRSEGIPYAPESRTDGATKWSRLSLLALSIEGITSFSALPLRIVSGIGAIIAVFGLAYGVKIIFEVLFYGIAAPGYPSLMVAVLVLGGINLTLLGLLGEYLWVNISETKNRPIYIVRDVRSALTLPDPKPEKAARKPRPRKPQQKTGDGLT